jgi:hypothetical protein
VLSVLKLEELLNRLEVKLVELEEVELEEADVTERNVTSVDVLEDSLDGVDELLNEDEDELLVEEVVNSLLEILDMLTLEKLE